MAKQEKSDTQRELESISISVWKFRLRAVNPGRNTFLLIALLALVFVCLSLLLFCMGVVWRN